MMVQQVRIATVIGYTLGALNASGGPPIELTPESPTVSDPRITKLPLRLLLALQAAVACSLLALLLVAPAGRLPRCS